MNISIGADHGGYKIKQILTEWLQSEGLSYNDFGTFSDDSVDYPKIAHSVSKSIENHEANFGILICGSGQGMAITANKHKAIRAALCWETAIAALARQHNDANILVLPGRFLDSEQAIEITRTFLNTLFEGGRHQKRIEQIVST